MMVLLQIKKKTRVSLNDRHCGTIDNSGTVREGVGCMRLLQSSLGLELTTSLEVPGRVARM